MDDPWGAVVLALAWIAVIALSLYMATKEYRPMPTYLRDLLERIAATFAQAFLGALTVGAVLDLGASLLQQAAMAGVAAVLSLAKGLVARKVGDHDTASLAV